MKIILRVHVISVGLYSNNRLLYTILVKVTLFLVTARKRSLGQGNIFAPVCHSVHRGVYLSACWDTPLRRPSTQEETPQRRSPQRRPQEETPLPSPWRRPPQEETPEETFPPRETPKKRPPRRPPEKTPLGGDPLPRGDPPGRRPLSPEKTPLAQSMLGDTVNTRAARILLECNLVILTVLMTTDRHKVIYDIRANNKYFAWKCITRLINNFYIILICDMV